MAKAVRRLRVPDDVAALVAGLHPQLKRKLRNALGELLVDPEIGKALKDQLTGLRSFRIGKFRLVYRATPKIIEVVAFGRRERIYEETLRLVSRD